MTGDLVTISSSSDELGTRPKARVARTASGLLVPMAASATYAVKPPLTESRHLDDDDPSAGRGPLSGLK